MSDLVDLPSWRLQGNGDLIQQIGFYLWMAKGDDYKEFAEDVTRMRILYELYQRISGEAETDVYQAQCIAAIAEYVKKHPNASEADLVKELTKQIEIFKSKLDS